MHRGTQQGSVCARSPRSTRRVWLCVLLVFAVSPRPSDANAEHGEQASPRPVIREIRFDRGTVFSDEEASDLWIFGVANDLHIVTREHVIHQELLFREGDPLDLELIDASERALRAFEFINEVVIEVIPVSDALVDVVVHTRDAWTIVPGILLESGGGDTKAGVTGRETNLLGFGKEVSFEVSHDTDVGTGFLAAYRDPQVWNSNWEARVSGRTDPLVDSASVVATRPFYSPDTRWAYGGFARFQQEIRRVFDNGNVESRVRETEHQASVFVARAFGGRWERLTADLQLGYADEREKLVSGDRVELRDDAFRLETSLGLFYREESWVEAKRIRRMSIVEDIQLGFNVGGRVGRAGVPVPVGEEYWRLSGSYRHALMPDDDHFVFFSGGVTSEDERNTILSLGGEYYFNGLDWQTFALNVRYRKAFDLDASRQITLGGDSGLRGFPTRRFDGNKALLVNAEARLYSPIEVLAVRVGGVVFLDAGRAFERSKSLELDELGASAGFGLRLGFTRAPNEPIGRIDFGWPLTEGGFALTVGAEQHF